MIKCFGSGKLLKLLSSILLIGFFGFGINSFVNAVLYYSPIGTNVIGERWNYYNNVSNLLNFFSVPQNSELSSDNILYFNGFYTNTKFFIGWKGNRLYSYGYYNRSNGSCGSVQSQGYINGVYLSENYTQYNSYGNYINPYRGDKIGDLSFINSISSNITYYALGSDEGLKSSSGYECGSAVLCLTTDETLYSYYDYQADNSNINTRYCLYPDYEDNEGYDFKTSSFDTIYSTMNFNSSPLTSSGGGGSSLIGSQDVIPNNTYTGDYVYSNLTYQQIFDYLESNGYSEYLCYGGINNFDLFDSTLSYDPVPLTGKTLGQILSYSNARDSPNDWFIFWNGLYLDRYNSNYNSMRESYPAVYYTWFRLYYRYGGSSLIFDTVREYCAMKTLDIDFDNTIYKGQYFKNIVNTFNGGSGTGDYNNVIGVNRDGIGNIGSGNDVITSNDPSVFIQDFFNELKASLPTRYDLGGGFLPVYIITFLCALVLFRFLSH